MPQVRRCKRNGCHALVSAGTYFCDLHKADEAEYVAKLNQRGSRTKYNTVTRNATEARKERNAFYRSKQWQSIRHQALERDHYLCQYCKAVGITTANSRIGDHVTPYEVAPDMGRDVSNIATACKDCDNVKRKLEQQMYGTGTDNLRNTKTRLSIADWSLLIKKKKDVREGL